VCLVCLVRARTRVLGSAFLMPDGFRHFVLTALLALALTSGCGRDQSHVDARPSGSFVPATASWLRVYAARDTGRGVPAPQARSLQIGNRGEVEAVARLINSFGVAQAGPAPQSCPEQAGILYVWLVFREGQTGRRVAIVRVDPFDCGPGTVSIATAARPRSVLLRGDPRFVPHLEQIVGAKLAGL